MGQQDDGAAVGFAAVALLLKVPRGRLGLGRFPNLKAVGGRLGGVGVGGDADLEDVGDVERQRARAFAQQQAAMAQELQAFGRSRVVLPAIPAQRAEPPPAGARLGVAIDPVVALPAHHDANAGAVAGAGEPGGVHRQDGDGHSDSVVAPGEVADAQQAVELHDRRPGRAVVDSPLAVDDLGDVANVAGRAPVDGVGLWRPGRGGGVVDGDNGLTGDEGGVQGGDNHLVGPRQQVGVVQLDVEIAGQGQAHVIRPCFEGLGRTAVDGVGQTAERHGAADAAEDVDPLLRIAL